MKTKLTHSIDLRKVALLRKASARKGKSISELVEKLADKTDEQPGAEGEREANILKWPGFWAKHVSEADFAADDRPAPCSARPRPTRVCGMGKESEAATPAALLTRPCPWRDSDIRIDTYVSSYPPQCRSPTSDEDQAHP